MGCTGTQIFCSVDRIEDEALKNMSCNDRIHGWVSDMRVLFTDPNFSFYMKTWQPWFVLNGIMQKPCLPLAREAVTSLIYIVVKYPRNAWEFLEMVTLSPGC